MKSFLQFIQIHKSVKQHATRFSAVVVVLLFGLFLQAYMHDFNLVYITLFFVFSFAFSAGPIGVLNIGSLKSTFLKQGRFFAEVEGKIPLQLYNPSKSTAWAIDIFYDKDTFLPLEKLESDTSTILQLPYTPNKRGHFTYEGVYLESKYPLSTARLTKLVKEIFTALAYPQPKGKSLNSFLSEDESHYGEEKEFDGLRDYDGSQKLSHIHWASVAKGELSVKTFVKEHQTQNLLFHFFTSGSDDEARLSQLCLWALSCEKLHLTFDIQMPQKRLSSNKESIDEILSYLAKY
ncbi:MAG: DUF58 domain-containing protein [Sulfurovum sp.]|nr:DUF58 domain-containing protein [Sulfurovum sp.]